MNLAEIVGIHALRRPHHPAIVHSGGAITYREFDLRIRGWSGQLAALGVGRGSMVGLCLKDRAAHLIGLFALARLGAIVLPMDWRWTGDEKRRLAAFFRPHIVLVEPDDEVPDSRTVAVDKAWEDAVPTADLDAAALVRGDHLPLILALSSGTTGEPKGPLISHEQMLARFMIYYLTLGFTEHERFFCATPLYFGATRGYAMCSIYAGATVILFPPPYEMPQLVEAVRSNAATSLFLVPTLLRRLLTLASDEGPMLGDLRLLFSTGAVLHPEERERIMARIAPRYVNFYGSTDGGGAAALMAWDPTEVAHSVGRPVFGALVEIVDDDHRPVPPGAIGRIRYRNAGTASGYHDNPDASAETFRDGWFYPGDLGWIDDAGYLYLAGREKDVIIRGGVNIYPAEVEHVLLAHAGVHDAAVVAWPSREMGEEVAAFVVRRRGASERELIEHCRSTLAPYKVPRAVFFVDDLPRSSAGKVLKADLRARLPELQGGVS